LETAPEEVLAPYRERRAQVIINDQSAEGAGVDRGARLDSGLSAADFFIILTVEWTFATTNGFLALLVSPAS
jgi:hypothetical protein